MTVHHARACSMAVGHRVKSVTMGSFTPEEVRTLEALGNEVWHAACGGVCMQRKERRGGFPAKRRSAGDPSAPAHICIRTICMSPVHTGTHACSSSPARATTRAERGQGLPGKVVRCRRPFAPQCTQHGPGAILDPGGVLRQVGRGVLCDRWAVVCFATGGPWCISRPVSHGAGSDTTGHFGTKRNKTNSDGIEAEYNGMGRTERHGVACSGTDFS
eukprot:364694-Chlamydomonas_euryale.AAC.8